MHLRFSALVAAAFLSACANGPSMPAPHVNAPAPGTLAISPVQVGHLDRIRIDLTLAADMDGETVFLFPERWGPDENLGQLVSHRTVTDPVTGLPVPSETDDGRITVASPPGQILRLSYQVQQDYQGLPQWGVQRMPGMRPVLQPDYASLIGHTFLPSVEGRDPEIEVTLADFDQGAAFSQPTRSDTSAAMPLSTAQDSVYALGAFQFGDTGAGVRTAVLGEWRLLQEDIETTTTNVLTLAGEAFQDAAFEDYFLTLTPLPDLPEGSSVIGTGLTQSFLLLATRNAEPENLTHTITHEILHEWITRRMGQTDEATDPARMWFTEGITEYYTQLVLLGSGETTLDGFIEALNTLWTEYNTSTVNTLPAGELIEHIWDSRETERLPYQRGALLALHWDTLARAEGRSLDGAIRALLQSGNAARARGDTPVLTDAAIHTALEDAIGPWFKADFNTYVQTGEKLQLEDLALPDCLTIVVPAGRPSWLARTPGADAAACRAQIAGAFFNPTE